MAPQKPDKFTDCFCDFVRYLNVVEPYDHQDGILDCRIGIVSRDSGELAWWMQDMRPRPDDDDAVRYDRIFSRVDHLIGDLNTCRSFVDANIAHTFALSDYDDGLRFEVIYRDR